VERGARLIEDPIVSEYVNRIGQNLVRHSDARYSFVIKVVRSEEVNAMALPGGFLFINSGLVRAAGTEAELAAAMAHEIAHVAARHYTRHASWEQILSYASIPLVFIGGWPGFVIQQGAAAGEPLALRKLSRDAENEADRLGIQYAYQTGYDPVALVDFLERIPREQNGQHGPFARMLASHPPLRSRIRGAQKQIQKNLSPQPQYLVQTSEFQLVKARLTSIENGIRVPWQPAYQPVAADQRPVLRRAP
jgi:predicted Zn-dependent protease